MDKEKPSPKDEKLIARETEANPDKQPEEVGGFEKRKEPTRYGDWEVGGRCSDF